MSAYTADSDLPHPAGESDFWQESDCYWFYDAKAGVGGYHRIGQYLRRGTGQVLIFAFKTGGERFRLVREYAGSDVARSATGQQVGSSTVEALGDGVMRYGWNEDDCAADLTFDAPVYTPRSWLKNENTDAGAAAVAKRMNTGGHLEVAGRIQGSVRIGGETYQIDALAHRDRSWGARDYRTAHQHRMITGTIGPSLSWAAYIMHLDNGMVAKAGFVARHGETVDLEDIKVLTEFDWDGVTVTGVRTLFVLKDGTTEEIRGPACEATTFETEGWLLSSHTFIELADGGFSILDTTNRPSKGEYMPKPEEVSAICIENGLSRGGDFGAFRWP